MRSNQKLEKQKVFTHIKQADKKGITVTKSSLLKHFKVKNTKENLDNLITIIRQLLGENLIYIEPVWDEKKNVPKDLQYLLRKKTLTDESA